MLLPFVVVVLLATLYVFLLPALAEATCTEDDELDKVRSIRGFLGGIDFFKLSKAEPKLPEERRTRGGTGPSDSSSSSLFTA